jgi:hypothetical protein
MNNLNLSFSAFNAKRIYENSDTPIDMDETILDKIVELVGSEEDVEESAKEAFEELNAAFERNEVEIKDGEKGENLAISSLILKLVEKGKLGPQDADQFLEDSL